MRNMATYTEPELQRMLNGMRAASSVFYGHATSIGNPAFIAFTGLMNEYIKICEDAFLDGKDFTEFNIHSGKSLIKSHQRAYLIEKLECILGCELGVAELDNLSRRKDFK